MSSLVPYRKGQCTVCDLDGPIVCAGCGDAKYCSLECQRTDWRTHKNICWQLGHFADPPTKTLVRALLLPTGRRVREPQFIWAGIEWDERTGCMEVTNLCQHLNGRPCETTLIEINPVRNKQFPGRGIRVFRNAEDYYFKQNLNVCFTTILTGQKQWHGRPLVATQYYGNILFVADQVRHQPGRGIDSADFRNVVDYNMVTGSLYPSNLDLITLGVGDPRQFTVRAKKIRGIRIRWKPSEGTLRCEPTSYPQDHPAFMLATTPIEGLSGKPKYWRNDAESKPVPCQADRFYFNLFPKAGNLNLRKDDAREVDVWRTDDASLTLQHLSALLAIVTPSIQAAIRGCPNECSCHSVSVESRERFLEAFK